VKFKNQMQEIARDIGFSSDAFGRFYNDVFQKDYHKTNIPHKFYSLLGIAEAGDTSGLVMFSSLTPGISYHADEFFNRFHEMGAVKIFDPGLFSERLGEMLSSTFLKMLLIIGIN